MELLFRNERYCYSLWQGKKLEFKDTCFEGVYLNNFVGFLLRNVYQKGCVANKDALRVVYAFEDKLSLLDEVYLFIS